MIKQDSSPYDDVLKFESPSILVGLMYHNHGSYEVIDCERLNIRPSPVMFRMNPSGGRHLMNLEMEIDDNFPDILDDGFRGLLERSIANADEYMEMSVYDLRSPFETDRKMIDYSIDFRDGLIETFSLNDKTMEKDMSDDRDGYVIRGLDPLELGFAFSVMLSVYNGPLAYKDYLSGPDQAFSRPVSPFRIEYHPRYGLYGNRVHINIGIPYKCLNRIDVDKGAIEDLYMDICRFSGADLEDLYPEDKIRWGGNVLFHADNNISDALIYLQDQDRAESLKELDYSCHNLDGFVQFEQLMPIVLEYLYQVNESLRRPLS